MDVAVLDFFSRLRKIITVSQFLEMTLTFAINIKASAQHIIM
jgi:hypothetical protein